jgi:hypothetical protein
VVDLLRVSVTTAHAAYKKTFDEQMASLTASDNWKKLKTKQQQKILADERIAAAKALKVGTEDELITEG